MEQTENRVCTRCLLADFAPDEYLENMRIYLKGLGADSKTEEVLYRKRLEACTECDNLMEGLCRKCGCFVEYRAAIKRNNCPDLHPKW